MFVYSFKASSCKALFIACAVALVLAVVVAFVPKAGSGIDANKLDIHDELKKINVKSQEGRQQYLSTLGFDEKAEEISVSEEVLPKDFDAVLESYNKLQKMQGFDLERYKGKKLKGCTYKITEFPEGAVMPDYDYYATLIVYKNKVVGADLCCPETGDYSVLIRTA